MAKKLEIEFAGSIISNYKYAYKQKFNESFNGTDTELLKIINDEPTWASSEEQDEATLESMADFHDGNRINLITKGQ